MQNGEPRGKLGPTPSVPPPRKATENFSPDRRHDLQNFCRPKERLVTVPPPKNTSYKG